MIITNKYRWAKFKPHLTVYWTILFWLLTLLEVSTQWFWPWYWHWQNICLTFMSFPPKEWLITTQSLEKVIKMEFRRILQDKEDRQTTLYCKISLNGSHPLRLNLQVLISHNCSKTSESYSALCKEIQIKSIWKKLHKPYIQIVVDGSDRICGWHTDHALCRRDTFRKLIYYCNIHCTTNHKIQKSTHLA